MFSTIIPRRPFAAFSGAVLLCASMAATGAPAQADRSGDWQLRASSDDQIELHFRYQSPASRHWSSTDVPLAALDGLTRAQLRGAPTRVSFRLVREAGVFHMIGRIANEEGRGTWRFVEAPDFAQALQRRGYERPTEEQQLRLALHDGGIAMVEELAAQKYKRPKTSELVWMAEHGVDLRYLRRMGRLGYQVRETELLVRLRDHGVDPGFVSGMRQCGYTELTVSSLIRMRDHGVDPEFVGGFRQIGYGDLSVDELVDLRDHGVTPEFAGEIAAAGFPRLAPEQLKKVRDHGVDAGYARRAKARIRDVTIEEVIELRDRGVRL